MFAGVGLAVALGVAVAFGLNLLAATLPQAQQEMLETVIGAIAVMFVTTMILWMNRHSVGLKGELEREAQEALNTGSSLALAAGFLAVAAVGAGRRSSEENEREQRHDGEAVQRDQIPVF